MPLHFKSLQIISIGNINAKTVASTSIFTTENGTRTFYCIGASIECTAATLVTTPMTASIGTNSTTFNNILPVTLMTGLNAVNLHLPLFLSASQATVAPNTGIFINITIGATATAQTITVHLLGFYS